MAAINPVRGHGTYLGFGQETNWGDAVSRTHWLRPNSVSLRRVRTKEAVPDLGRLGQNSSNDREFFVTEDRVEGSFQVNMAYDDSTLLLLKHLMGDVATTGVANPWTHAFSLLSPQPEGLTIESGPGNGDIAGNVAQVFSGCLLSRGTLTVVPGRPVTLDLDVMGKTSGGLTGQGTPTYSSKGNKIYQQHAGTATLGSDAVKYKQMIVRVDRGLEPLREVGSLNPSRPVESRLSVEVELLLAWQLSKFHDNYFADTLENWSVAFDGGSDRAMTIVGHNSLVMDTSEPISAAGQVEQRVLLKCFAGSSDQGLAIEIDNSNNSATAN